MTVGIYARGHREYLGDVVQSWRDQCFPFGEIILALPLATLLHSPEVDIATNLSVTMFLAVVCYRYPSD
jgi:hypothetical protein